jgi:hypothetical protein
VVSAIDDALDRRIAAGYIDNPYSIAVSNEREPTGVDSLGDYYEPEKVKVNFMDDATKNHMVALIQEVEILKTRIQPHDTGHIHTTIHTLEHRIKEMRESVITGQ